jgi:hypothetical protein
MDKTTLYSLVFANSALFVAFLTSFYWCFLMALVILLCFTAYATVKGAPTSQKLAADVYCSYRRPDLRTGISLVPAFISVNTLFFGMFLSTFHVCFLAAGLTLTGFVVYVFREVNKELKKVRVWSWEVGNDLAEAFAISRYCFL